MHIKRFIILATSVLFFLSCAPEPVINRVPGRVDKPNENTGNGDNTGGDNTGTENGEGDNILTCSFNIRYYNTTDPYTWNDRKPAIKKFIDTVKPDIVGFQEVRPTQSQDITSMFKDDYGYYDINRDTGYGLASASSGEGVGIIYKKSRFTLVEKGFFWLADTPDKLPNKNEDGTYSAWNSSCRRVTVWVKLKDKMQNDKLVYFFCTHFDHKSTTARTNSSTLSISKIKEITKISNLSASTVPIFLVADFNCAVSSSELATLVGNMKDARTHAKKTESGRTFNNYGETSSSIIDMIFYVGPIEAEQYHVVTEDYGVKYISDHYPILLYGKYKK